MEELCIGLIKEAVRKGMKEVDSLQDFLDYCVEKRHRFHNLGAKNLFQLHGSNTHAALPGEEHNVSNLHQHGWHDWYYHKENANIFLFSKEMLGRFFRKSKGSVMRCPNGYSKPIVKLYQEDHFVLFKCQECIHSES